jgi:biopolymer transport protein TolR
MNLVERGPNRRRRPLSEINVTPFVDVMLVLLVIFMVTAPLMQQGIPVELPKTQTAGLTLDEEPLVVTVKRDGSLYVERARVDLADLEVRMESILQARGDGEVFLRADGKVAYETVAKALAILRKAGAKSIGMVTEPEA